MLLIALLGVGAMRTGKRLVWDNASGRITSHAKVNQHLEIKTRDGWKFHQATAMLPQNEAHAA